MTAATTTQTAPTDNDLPYQVRELWFRRAFTALLAVFQIAAVLGVFGVRTADVSATGDGYELTVHYGRITRPGLATPWEVEVVADEGFDGPIIIETSAAYFDLFDENGLDPEPSSVFQDGEMITWEFDPPEGSVFTLSFDARIEPAVQWGKSATTRLLDGKGHVVASVDYKTTVLP